jgi:hypothetical protein
VVETIDNWLIRELNLKKQLKRLILDAYNCGTAVIKEGYDSEFGYIKEQAVDEGSSTVTQIGRKTGTKAEYYRFIKAGMPWALRVRPEDIVVPWGSTDSDNLPWVAHIIMRPIDDIKEDQKYKNTEDLQGTMIPFLEGSPLAKAFRGGQKDLKWGVITEIRDFKEGRIYAICEDTEILNAEDELQIESLPYDFLIFNEDPEYFSGIPDSAILAPQQKELNETRTQASLHRKIALLKFLVKKNIMDPKAKEAFLSGDIGAMAEVDTDSLAADIMAFQPHIPPDLQGEVRILLEFMREEIGFSQNQMGEFIPLTSKTAREVGEVSQGSQIRVDERRDIMADLLVSIVRKWNQFIFKFWDAPKVARIVGPEGGKHWVTYTGQELEGEYFLLIDPDTGVPTTREARDEYVRGAFELLRDDQLIDQKLLRKVLLNRLSAYEPMAPLLLMEGQMPPSGEEPLPLGEMAEKFPEGAP